MFASSHILFRILHSNQRGQRGSAGLLCTIDATVQMAAKCVTFKCSCCRSAADSSLQGSGGGGGADALRLLFTGLAAN